MTFLEMQTNSLARVDIDISDVEPQGLQAVKDSINSAYMILCSIVDKRTTTATFALDDYNNKIPVPHDLVELVLAEHEAIGEVNPSTYEIIGDLIHFKSRDLTSGDITLTYAQYPDKLVKDSDELKIKDIFIGAITAYAAYTYQLYKKKYAAAQLLLQEFNSYIPVNQRQEVQQAVENAQ